MSRTGKLACGLFALLVAGAPPSALGEEVVLTASDGVTSFEGDLLSFDGERYTLATSLGTLAFPAGDVTCSGPGCPAPPGSHLRIAGAPHLLRFALPEMIDGYSLMVDTDLTRDRDDDGNLVYELLTFEGEPVVTITLVEAGPDAAMRALVDGEVGLAVVPRPATEAERMLLGEDLREGVLATNAVVALAGSSVPIEAIAADQLLGIFSGEITNWSALGGPDLPVAAFVEAEGAESRSMLEHLLMRPRGRQLGPAVITLDAPGAMEGALASFPNGIALAGFDAANSSVAIPVIDRCGRAVAPGRFAVKSGGYPISSPVNAYWVEGALDENARGLMQFVLSELGQELLPATGYADILPETASEADFAPDRGAATGGALRLSAGIVFGPGENAPGPGAKATLDRLAVYLGNEDRAATELVFVGLSEDREAGLASARDAVSALFAAYPDIEEDLAIAFRVAGAKAMPCELATDGAREVEIWLRPLGEG